MPLSDKSVLHMHVLNVLGHTVTDCITSTDSLHYIATHRSVHDALSDEQLFIWSTPRGVLSSERVPEGVYVGQVVESKNVRKAARGRFKVRLWYQHCLVCHTMIDYKQSEQELCMQAPAWVGCLVLCGGQSVAMQADGNGFSVSSSQAPVRW
jgi:hypothetical protein